MRASVTSLFVLAASATAAIIDALNDVDASTLALNEAVGTWDGDLLGTLPIVEKSASLLITIKKGEKTASDAAELTFDETLAVAGATTQLASDVNTTLATVIAMKPDFDGLLLSPVILANLELQKHATDGFSGAVVEKVPKDLQGIAQGLVDGILNSFDIAIEEYKLF